MSNWYQDISWYGNLIEFIGAIVGILQYLGAERIKEFSQRFDIRKSSNYVKLTKWNIPVEKNLAEFLPMWKSFSVKMFLPQLAVLPFLVGFLVISVPLFMADLGVKGEILKYFGSTVWFIIVVSLGFIFLPLIFYLAIVILVILYLPLVTIPQLVIYYLLGFLTYLLTLTASHREKLIGISVGIVLFGVFLQVLGPMFDINVFLSRLQDLFH